MNRQPPTTSHAFDARFEAQRIAFGPLMFQAARALRDLGVLRELEKAPAKADALASRLDVPRNGLKALLDAGVSLRMVEETDGVYRIGLVGHLIQNDEMTRVNMNFVQDLCYRGAEHLAKAVATGRPAGLGEIGGDGTVYHGLARLPESQRSSWYAFDQFYSDASLPRAVSILFAKPPKRILDVGCAQGRFERLCLRADPVVEVSLVDLPANLERTLADLRAEGIAERIHGFGMDLLDPACRFPAGYDVVWMSQVLDCFGEADVVRLLRTAATALSDDGRIFVLEPYLDRQHEAGKHCMTASSLYFTFLANGRSRFYRSDEMEGFIRSAGLEVSRQVDGIGLGTSLTEIRKRR